MPRGLPAPALPGVIQVAGNEVELVDQPGYLTVSTVLWGPIEIFKLHTSPEQWQALTDSIALDADGISLLAATGVGLVCRLAAEPVNLTSWRRVVHTSSQVAGHGMLGWSLVADRGLEIHSAPAWSIYAAATASLAKRMSKDEREEWDKKMITPLEGEHILSGFIYDDTKQVAAPRLPKKPPKRQVQRDNAKALEQLKMMS